MTFACDSLKTCTSPRFTVPGESFAVEFVVIKHFGCESLHVQPSGCLDVVVYMLNCVFWRHIPLEIQFKSRGSDSNAQRYHPLAVAQLVTPKKKPRKIERGEFITPPRPTGRRSNKQRFSFKVILNPTQPQLNCINVLNLLDL